MTPEEYARLLQLTRGGWNELLEAVRLLIAIAGRGINDPAIADHAQMLSDELNKNNKDKIAPEVKNRAGKEADKWQSS
jgi:hypothetical protein